MQILLFLKTLMLLALAKFLLQGFFRYALLFEFW